MILGKIILDLENEGLKDNEVFLENFKGISVVLVHKIQCCI